MTTVKTPIRILAEECVDEALSNLEPGSVTEEAYQAGADHCENRIQRFIDSELFYDDILLSYYMKGGK